CRAEATGHRNRFLGAFRGRDLPYSTEPLRSMMLGKLVSPFLALFRRSELNRELDEELRFHLEREVEENIRRGMSPQGARRRAMVSFGGVEQIRKSVATCVAADS